MCSYIRNKQKSGFSLLLPLQSTFFSLANPTTNRSHYFGKFQWIRLSKNYVSPNNFKEEGEGGGTKLKPNLFLEVPFEGQIFILKQQEY